MDLTMMSSPIKWSRAMVLKLISNYKKYKILWNAKSKREYSQIEKNEAWNQIAADMSLSFFKISPKECRRKMHIVLSCYRREKSKLMKHIDSGTNEPFETSWFAFENMQFILNRDIAFHNSKNDHRKKLQIGPIKKEFDKDTNEQELKVVLIPLSKDDDSFMEENLTVQSSSDEESLSPIKSKYTDSEDNHMSQTDHDNIINIQDDNGDDECQAFGNFVGKKLKNFTPHTRNAVEHAINNILFNADYGYYESQSYTSLQLTTKSDRKISYLKPI